MTKISVPVVARQCVFQTPCSHPWFKQRTINKYDCSLENTVLLTPLPAAVGTRVPFPSPTLPTKTSKWRPNEQLVFVFADDRMSCFYFIYFQWSSVTNIRYSDNKILKEEVRMHSMFWRRQFCRNCNVVFSCFVK